MTVLLRCLRRKASLTREEFQEDWHQRALRRAGDARMLRRCVQYHTFAEPTSTAESGYAALDAVETPYDGISLEWFDSPEAVEQHLHSDFFATEFERESWYVDHAQSFARVADPLLVIAPEDVAVVLVQCLRRRSDLDRRRFHEIWSEHTPWGFRMNHMGWLQGYQQIRWSEQPLAASLNRLGGEGPVWDGLVLLYAESRAAIKAMLAHPLLEESAKHSAEFLADNGWLAMTTRRHVIKRTNE
jgi:hypothetical protein